MPKQLLIAGAVGAIVFGLYKVYRLPPSVPVALPGVAARHPSRARQNIGALRKSAAYGAMPNYQVPAAQVFPIWNRR
jgi:hypothetical protein